MATTTTTSSLTYLLAQCEKCLHSGSLSLRQLAPVHQSLIQCSRGPSGTVKDPSSIAISGDADSLDAVIKLFCDSAEAQARCQQILSSDDNNVTDPQRLLAIQYLMFPLSSTSSADAMRYVLMPYLLHHDDISDGLKIVLLECIDDSVIVEDTPAWMGIVESLKTANPKNIMASRLLVRLVPNSPAESSSMSSALVAAFFEKMWQLLQASALTVDFQKDPLILCLSRDMIPILTNNHNTSENDEATDGIPNMWTDAFREHTVTLWKRLFSLPEMYPKQERQIFLIMTTILCPLLPHLVDVELPVPNHNDDSNTSPQKPHAQPSLWSLIYSCLEQGKSILEKQNAVSSLLRKRALYLLDKLAATSPSNSGIWKKYVMCVEVLEMESEQHLVDQIWDTAAELLKSAVEEGHQLSNIGVLTRDWMGLLFSRILSSDQLVIRKLGIYRLIKIAAKSKPQKKQGKKKTRNIAPRNDEASRQKAMLAHMPPEFFFHVFLPSWNSLSKSVGYNMHLEDNRKVEREDMVPLFTTFLNSYVEQLGQDDATEFWQRFWSWEVHQHLYTKTIILVFQSLAQKLSSSELAVHADNDTLESLLNLFENLFRIPSVVTSHRKDLLQSLATILEYCQQSETMAKWTPLNVLRILSLFSEDYFTLEDEEWTIESDKLLDSLKRWIVGFNQDATTLGAAVSAAFVSGQLAPPSDQAWDSSIGNSNLENDLGWAIPLLCTIAASQSPKTTTGELLWPSISRGLANSAGTILTNDRIKARSVSRAIVLLENGCKLRQLSGLGNGDLVVDKDTQQLMPPPANIEKQLSGATDFIMYHIRTLLSMKANEEEGNDNTGSSLAKGTAKAFGRLISQLQTLQRSYPSSDILPSVVSDLLVTSCNRLREGAEDDNNRVLCMSLVLAAVSAGADPGRDEYIPLCRILLDTRLAGDIDCSKEWAQTVRTLHMYSKWGAISCILPMLIKSLEGQPTLKQTEADSFFRDLLSSTFDAVGATSISALPLLFDCILKTGEHLSKTSESDRTEYEFGKIFSKIIDALIRIMDGTSGSSVRGHMLNEICRLAFQPKLLSEEYRRLQHDPKSPDPVRRAFRRLIKMAGVQRHHISRAVLCRITVAWLGEDQTNTSTLGLNAIPYRDDIVQVLIHKEQKLDETALSQSRDGKLSGVAEIPAVTNDQSVSRAFVLIFLSKLPDPGNGLNDTVLKELLHYIILRLLIVTAPAQATNHVLIMKGTPDYVKKIRGWQALCNLARFATREIADEVCSRVFKAIPEPIHSQIRFFLEIFTIKCATMHPGVFGPAFVKAIGQTDLTLPHVSSLMIMGGNWIVGRYKIDFFKRTDTSDDLHLRQVLAAVIPWLSSTQGFSRAIAQLLVYALIPLVTDVSKIGEKVSVTDTDWFIRLVYKFLEENREMKRLRNKQSKFFEKYDVEEMCTAEGVLSVPTDEGDEASPEHLIDAMKVALKNVYEEAHASDAPEWKQVEKILQSKEQEGPGDASTEGDEGQSEVNFQRKIIPIDALNLAMEDLREKKLRNIAGRRKQQLIVCASLIDKVPNLGGLARTAEIFAADRLTIPDVGVTKMDNFKSISVGAGDWIDIEEVKEQDLLSWLLDHKKNGYFVFGLEQTSSSVSISEMQFPDRPTILLLGKEKEGIPVEYLQAVDQCVEIPQLGIIRSLNVHVSGAIAIWEHTKQRTLASKAS